MNNPNFSVLMSLYGKEKPRYLSDCLESLNNQTCQPNEIIIVLDGKLPDALHDILNQWRATLPLTLIPLEHNVGLGKALNVGLAACSNELVARMDTDDICLPTRFASQIAYMADNPDVVLLGCHIVEFDEAMLTKVGRRAVPTTYEQIVKQARLNNPFNHMSVVFRKTVIEKVGGYRHHFYMEDYNLWLRIIAAGYRVANLNDYCLNVRGGSSMIKRRKGMNYIKSEYQLAKLKLSLGMQNGIAAGLCFVIRSLPRLLPVSLLTLIYKKTRCN